MEYIVVPDTAIFAVNYSKKDNQSSSIVYSDGDGRMHSIDFHTCAFNFKKEHKSSSCNCIGERKMDEHYFIFYTSGIKTKVVFEKMYVGNLLRHHILYGSKPLRFLALHTLISKTKYTTYDLS